MRVRLALAAAALAVSVTACNGSAKPAAQTGGATVPTAAPTTTTTNPYAIPATIDAAYVNRVLAGLDALVGDVVRMVVATKSVPREGADRLRAVYASDGGLNATLDSISRDLARGLVGVRQPPGDKITKVSELIAVSTSCIFSRVLRDYSQVAASSISAESTQWIAIRTLEKTRDPFEYNRVGWAYVYEGSEPDNRQPSNPCA